MRKFFVLLKKEMKDLLTLQVIIPLLIGVLIFVLLGQVMGGVIQDEQKMGKLVVVDLDSSTTSTQLIKSLTDVGINVTIKQLDIDDAIDAAKSLDINSVIEIPKGFEQGISEGKQQEIKTYSIIDNFAISGDISDATISSVIVQINDIVSNQMITEQIEGADPATIKNPIVKDENVVVNGKKANISAGEIMNFVMSQSVFIPIVMLMIIIYAASMMISTIATEKENKTLETLLSTPISRTAMIAAKMVAAGIISLLFAGVYMFGFKYYMDSLTGGMMIDANSQSLNSAIETLGLNLYAGDYVLLGLSLFMSILIALAAAAILGGFAEDVKNGQSLLQPIIYLVLISYLLTLFVDMNSTSFGVRLLINILPFTHPFNASPYLFLDQYLPVVMGIIYQTVIFIILIVVATKIFSSDKIFTKKLRTRKQKKLKA